MKKQYVVYDARYRTEDYCDASVVLVTEDLAEAKKTVNDEWNGGVTEKIFFAVILIIITIILSGGYF